MPRLPLGAKACTPGNLKEINIVKLSIVVSAHIARLIKETVRLTTEQRVFALKHTVQHRN